MGVRLIKTSEMDVFYIGFNMKDPLVGQNKALRQAMSLAYDTEWRIEHLANGRAISAQSCIPPGMFGYDPEYHNPYKGPDLEAARQKLAEAGFPNGIGPDGKQLEVAYDIGAADPAARQNALAFAEDMAEIGIKVNVVTNTWSEFLDKLRTGRLQVFTVGWILDYPDPENFLQLLYGPNKAPGPNSTSYDNPEFNEMFDRMKIMQDGPERYALVRQMVDISVEDAPWIPSVHSLSYILVHQWVRNYKPHGMTGSFIKYRDVDVDLRARLRREWNRVGAWGGP
jgi:ABC-type transport system substrate-binding protein